MKKVLTEYTLEEEGDIVNIFRVGVSQGCGVLGIVSALEAIFVIEELTKKDWLLHEEGRVFLVDREEHGISKERETEL